MTDTYHLTLSTTEPVDDAIVIPVTQSFFDRFESDPGLFKELLPDDGEWEKVYLSHKHKGFTQRRIPSERPFSLKI